MTVFRAFLGRPGVWMLKAEGVLSTGGEGYSSGEAARWQSPWPRVLGDLRVLLVSSVSLAFSTVSLGFGAPATFLWSDLMADFLLCFDIVRVVKLKLSKEHFHLPFLKFWYLTFDLETIAFQVSDRWFGFSMSKSPRDKVLDHVVGITQRNSRGGGRVGWENQSGGWGWDGGKAVNILYSKATRSRLRNYKEPTKPNYPNEWPQW